MPDIQMNPENRPKGALSLTAGGVKITEAFKALLGGKEFAAITIAESLIAVVGITVFRRGRWKTREV